jgi:hypothetical protein
MFYTLIVVQHPRGESTNTLELTLKNCSTAAGVTVIVVAGTGSPSIATAREIGPTVSPVGTAILPPKDTLKRARH